MASHFNFFRVSLPSAALTLAALFCMPTTLLFAADQQETNVDVVEEPEYLVNPGDVLAISVWKEEDLQNREIVRPDGFFSFPLAGDVQAKGRSVEEIRVAVAERLEKYIPDPVVTVSVLDLAGNSVYVIGQVNRPGEFRTGRRVDVMQALTMGGGTTTFAQLGDIKILRRVNGKLIAIPFDYKDIEKGKRLNQNILLEPGDVVVVP